MRDGSVSRIAMRVAALDEDSVEELYGFYGDAGFAAEQARRLADVVRRMLLDADAYSSCVATFDECVDYLADMPDSDVVKRPTKDGFRRRGKAVHDAYADYANASDDERSVARDSYLGLLSDMLAFCQGYEKSCVSQVRNRFVEDERNVRGLLDTINDNGNDVLNGGAGH